MSRIVYKNTAFPPPSPPAEDAYHLTTVPEEYDLNFCFPVKALESSLVKLEPFIPSLHAREYFDALSEFDTQTLFSYLPYGPFPTLHSFLNWLELRIRTDSGSQLFVIHSSGKLAGVIGYLKGNYGFKSVEIGHIVILPTFQGTKVTTHAVGLMEQYAMEELKLWRCQWYCHDMNAKSKGVALRMGMQEEGLLRWEKRFGNDKPGLDGRDSKGRHSRVLAVTWEDWENGVREKVNGLLEG
ncbi:acyl-CoA N-acyltransferase [Atractiella rhizophila]|nr:acyl-CoA N-acyltransferase [Atractiella rhizophila]